MRRERRKAFPRAPELPPVFPAFRLHWVLLLGIICPGVLLTGCRSGKKQDKLLVATAANVQFAMQEIEAAFEAQSDLEVEVIISSSGKLTAQIQQGAPYDLLVSADMKYPQNLYDKGLAAHPPEVYAYGALVLWTMRDLALDSIADLLRQPTVKKIALANPKVAPYGELTMQWLKDQQLLPDLESKLIYGESIAQTNQYISSGACDLGFTARSVVVAPGVRGKGRWVIPDPRLRMEQGVVITRKGQAQHPEEAEQFYAFLFSETARSILSRHGYDVPDVKKMTQ